MAVLPLLIVFVLCSQKPLNIFILLSESMKVFFHIPFFVAAHFEKISNANNVTFSSA